MEENPRNDNDDDTANLHSNYLSPPPHLLNQRQFPPPLLRPSHAPQFTPLNPSPTPTPPSKKPKTTPSTSSDDASTLDTPRRRGRPAGAKNKPKPPVFIRDPESEPAFSSYILEVPSGSDLINSLTRFTHRRNLSLCVLSATGSIENVTLKQARDADTLSFLGRFDIISISACLIPGNAVFSGSIGFSVLLAGPRGQIVGGKVVGPLICAGTVYVVGTSFTNPGLTRLPIEENGVGQGGGGGGGGGDGL